MALADRAIEQAPQLWRHMAMANPESIGFAHTHPTSAERFVRMEETIEEISRKRRSGEALRPEMKDN